MIIIHCHVLESFLKADPSGRVPYSSLPNIIERFGINLTENDVVSAAKDLEYNGKKNSERKKSVSHLFSILVNDPISARRFIHVLVKLGKITKSTQQQPQPQRPPGSPSMLPEDREVTDIMTQRKVNFLLLLYLSTLIIVHFRQQLIKRINGISIL
jgi:hypothetical protein